MESANRKPIVQSGLGSIWDDGGLRAPVIGVERSVMMRHCPDSSGELVGQRDGRLVVALPSLQRQGPGLQAIKRLIFALPNLRGA